MKLSRFPLDGSGVFSAAESLTKRIHLRIIEIFEHTPIWKQACMISEPEKWKETANRRQTKRKERGFRVTFGFHQRLCAL